MKDRLIPIFIVALFMVMMMAVVVEGYNYGYVNVTAQVNVTSAEPEILTMYIEDPVVLNAGTTKQITCNATIRDWNGYNDIQAVNGTLFHELNESSPDHNNVHYTNSSCTEVSNDGEFVANYTCSFDVWHYADTGNWSCNVSAVSSDALSDTDIINTTFSQLYALNVTRLLDYGNLSVTEISSEIMANVTNFGNTDINVTVEGYGETEGDGVGLVCEQGENISVEHQRFSTSPTIWDDQDPLSSTPQDLSLTLSQPTQDSPEVVANTYWRLYVPPGPFGLCTGTVRFTAVAS